MKTHISRRWIHALRPLFRAFDRNCLLFLSFVGVVFIVFSNKLIEINVWFIYCMCVKWHQVFLFCILLNRSKIECRMGILCFLFSADVFKLQKKDIRNSQFATSNRMYNFHIKLISSVSNMYRVYCVWYMGYGLWVYWSSQYVALDKSLLLWRVHTSGKLNNSFSFSTAFIVI